MLTKNSVAMFLDETWTVFQQGQGFLDHPSFSSLTLDVTGRPWVGYAGGVAVYDNGSWQEFGKTGGLGKPESIILDARGWLWLGNLVQGLAMFDGQTWSNYTQETQNLSNNSVRALAADSLGRVWIGTWYGLTVFDGSQWQTYRMDNSDLMDTRVTFVVVERDGPTLAPLVDKEKGSLTGTLPVAGMRVEICAEPVNETFFGETPCDGQTFYFSTRSNNEGAFLFENIPAGYYYMFAENNNGWAELVGELGFFSERVLIRPGEQSDLGPLIFTQTNE